MAKTELPAVAVLMSTYNGEKYLSEQIDSILKQKDVRVRLLVRDDGSQDRTAEILERYRREGHLEWTQGENLGYTESFMQLCTHAPQADFYAFADQDDVWLPEKLKSAIKELAPCQDTPALCVCEWQMVDERLAPIHGAPSALPFPAEKLQKADRISVIKAACAMNHLTASGCLQVWNAALQKILCAHEYPHAPIGHDVIVGMAAILCGRFIPCRKVGLFYRQHGSNTSGSHSGWQERRARWKTHLARLKNQAGPNISECNSLLLAAYQDAIPIDARSVVQKTTQYRHRLSDKIALMCSDYPRLLYGMDRLKFRIKVLLNRL